jgi:membrane protein implicated in regulation of membrane protease activity
MLFRYLKRTETRVVTLADSIGRVGRVLVAISPSQTGKIRLHLGGSSVDVLATATVPLERGASVVVSECVGEQVVVTPAPLELGPEMRSTE